MWGFTMGRKGRGRWVEVGFRKGRWIDNGCGEEMVRRYYGFVVANRRGLEQVWRRDAKKKGVGLRWDFANSLLLNEFCFLVLWKKTFCFVFFNVLLIFFNYLNKYFYL